MSSWVHHSLCTWPFSILTAAGLLHRNVLNLPSWIARLSLIIELAFMSGQEDTWIWSRAHFSLSLSLPPDSHFFKALHYSSNLLEASWRFPVFNSLKSFKSLIIIVFYSITFNFPESQTFQNLLRFLPFWSGSILKQICVPHQNKISTCVLTIKVSQNYIHSH